MVKIKALDRNGKEVYETHSGYVARIFQHEVDHLEGVRFPERVPSQDRLHIVKADEMYAYRNQQGWKETISQKDWKEYLH